MVDPPHPLSPSLSPLSLFSLPLSLFPFLPKVPIAHAEEVEQVFDAISYCKGACVVKMLNAVLGMDMFKKGLQVMTCS